ncbi:unnamed protein product [Absidia cylindrospora]
MIIKFDDTYFYFILMFEGGRTDDGARIIVEIDESKFGKAKHHRGHEVEGVWVVGGVEKTRQRKVFVTTVVDRGANTMKNVITRFVLPGSIIRTDFWRSYDRIEEWTDDQGMSLDYVHQKVNHSQEFIAVNGVHTNTIEGTWNGIKMSVSARNRTRRDMPWKLVEFIWRRLHDDHWQGILDTLASVSFAEMANIIDANRQGRSSLTEYPNAEASGGIPEIVGQHLEIALQAEDSVEMQEDGVVISSSGSDSESDDSSDEDWMT